MANVCGKAYGLTAITRMKPWRTYGLRLVFAAIHVSLMKPWKRSAIFVPIVLTIVFGIVEIITRIWVVHPLPILTGPFAPALWLGHWAGLTGGAAFGVGFVVMVVALAFAAAVIGTFWQPRWTLLGRISQVQTNLIDLSFIHYARWVIIKKSQFPHFGDAALEEKLNYDYLLFESNFNGDWEKYIDAFSQVVPGGMDNIWRWSLLYPYSVPISPFLNYIRNCQYDTDHYYSAYPGAATNDVLGALALQAALDDLAARAAKLSPEQFAAQYAHFTVQVQNCIATTGAPPYPIYAEETGVALPTGAMLHSPSTAAAVSAR